MGQETIRRHDHQDISAHIGKLGIRFQTQTRGRVHPLSGKDHNIPVKDLLARQIIGRAQRFKNIGQTMI
jgi:predicted flavoprotein YhiN